jgi:two-component system probable response regulator PhcQ
MTTPARAVLAVDDEPEVLDSLRRTLRNEGYPVLCTTSPLEALALVDRGAAQVVIADIDMPEMSGTELVARIQASHPEVVRILLTGDASLESALAAINEGGVHRYLTKPWQKDKLRGVVREALVRFEELRADAEARAHAAARVEGVAEIERSHPGLRDATFVAGVYVIDATRLRDLLGRVATERMRALLDPPTTRVEIPREQAHKARRGT